MKIYAISFYTAFALSYVFLLLLIPVLKRLKAGQNILNYVKEHKEKNGTPTMGGLAFVSAAILTTSIFVRPLNRTLIYVWQLDFRI